jgi:nucleotide-binding universal stress UspA family protein
MKVLVAVDGSKYGRWTVEWVSRLPLVSPPQVAALHVVDTASLRAPFVVQPVIVGNERFIQAEIQRLEAQSVKVLAETETQLKALKLDGEVASEEGTAATTLLKRAPKRNGLVVLGSRGLGALDRFMLGSVSTQVVLHAPTSVLVVKEAPRTIKRVLLAIDGSDSAEKAIKFVLKELTPNSKGNPEILVTHAMQFLKYPELKEAGKAMTEKAARRLEKVGFVVEPIQRLGQPADEILKVAESHKADLIIMGAKGLGAIARFFLGSVSQKIVQHSHCSVLVVR